MAAGRWRNAQDMTDIPIAIARGEQPTLHTLAAFTLVSSAEIAVELLRWAEDASNGIAANPQHSNLFQILRDLEFAELHNPANISTYFAHLQSLDLNARLEAVKNLLPDLGLLRDPDLFSKDGVRPQLISNLECCRKIRYFPKAQQKEIGNRIKKFPERQRVLLERTLRLVETYQRTFSRSEFEKLDLQSVQDLLSLKPVKKKPEPLSESSEDTPQTETEIQEVSNESALHYAFAEALLDRDEGIRTDIASAVNEALAQQDAKSDSAFVTVSADEVDIDARLMRDQKLLDFVHTFCAEGAWGGAFGTQHGTLREAIDRYNGSETIVLSPDEAVEATGNDQSFTELLIRIDQVLGESLLEPVFRNYETARRNLLPLIDQLLFAPLETVGASERFEQFKQYIETANAFMRTLKDNYERLGRASENALNICISRALMFDVVLAKREGGHKAILMPLHPLHLWKFVRLIEIYMGGSEGLTASDREAIISEAASDRHFLSALDVNETLVDGQSITLPFAGSIGTLPCYENTTNHYTGSDGLESVFYTLDRYIQ